MKDGINRTFGSSFSLQSYVARSSFKDGGNLEGERTSISSNLALPRLSVAEILYNSGAGESMRLLNFLAA